MSLAALQAHAYPLSDGLITYAPAQRIIASTIRDALISPEQILSLQTFNPDETPQSRSTAVVVGELQEKWKFSSDHLPIGAKVDDFNLLSWNVLNTRYIGWVMKNSQGLSRSLITEQNQSIDGSCLTVRDSKIIDTLLATIAHPFHPRSILCLQECSWHFVQELKNRLPAHMTLVSPLSNAVDQRVIIYDNTKFDCAHQRVSWPYKESDIRKDIIDLRLQNKSSGKIYQIMNTHVPGDPGKPGRAELVNYLLSHYSKQDKAIPLLMGDLNFTEVEIRQAFFEAFVKTNPREDFNQYFNIFNKYNTNIAPATFEAKCIDHIIKWGDESAFISMSEPEEIMEGLKEMVDLLSTPACDHSCDH